MSPPLSVVVLTRNEAKNIEACLATVRTVADELIVFDSCSEDATRGLATEAGARVIEHPFETYPLQRNAALDASSGDWVFFVDADERASDSVAAEVRGKVSQSATATGTPVLYWIPRDNYIFGRLIRHTGWSPDYQPRLMRRGRVRFDPARPVHELPLTDGQVGYLSAALIHLNYETLAQFRAKQRAYTRFEAQMLYQQGSRFRGRALIGQPVREFGRRFFSLGGYKDGQYGLLLSLLMAYYAFERQRILRHMSRT